MRVAILWTHLSGYLNACLRELARIEDVELFVAHFSPSEEAPFDENLFSWLANRYSYETSPDRETLFKKVSEFQPDVLYVCSWHIPEYRYIARKFSGKVFRCFFMDNPWRSTFKQWIGVLTSKWYLHPLFDAVLLPGERQVVFAKKLGFKESQILRGMYSCDHPRFAAIFDNRIRDHSLLPNAFIYIGRFSEEKGLDVLARAYTIYRSKTSDPWPLQCYGAGRLRNFLEGLQGVEVCGFVQPDQLPEKLSSVSCLLMPSTFEPWGVAIHEATAAGLAVICTSSCGASVHLVQDGYNGFIVEPGNAVDLAQAMLRYSSHSSEQREQMSLNSHSISMLFTPQGWAFQFKSRLQEFLNDSYKLSSS